MLIFQLKRVIISILFLWDSFLIIEVWQSWFDLDSEFPVQEEILYEIRQSASQTRVV